MNRLEHLQRFYEVLSTVTARCGGARMLRDCDGGLSWPKRGVYFFFEAGETRSDSGDGPRVVRVGTHAVSRASKATLWNRLSQHRGRGDGLGGNHRKSIFRGLVGGALAARDPDLYVASWKVGQSAPEETRQTESPLERLVSDYIGRMPFAWLELDDEPSRHSMRAYIERNSIALLSQALQVNGLDRPSPQWLGARSPHADVRQSGLWNSFPGRTSGHRLRL